MKLKVAGIVLIQLLLAAIASGLIHFFPFYLLASFVICGATASFYTDLIPVGLRYLLIVLAPLYVSYGLYWFSRSSSTTNAEYEAWQMVAIIPGFLLGLVSSLFGYFMAVKFGK